MAYQTFGDRFSYNNTAFATVDADIDAFTDQDLLDLSPELTTMVGMVRRQSLLLSQASVKEIYLTITNHTDPQIALVLAAAKTADGSFRYSSQEAVKQFMFGPGTPTGTQYNNDAYNIFVEGIRRVSSALAASILILRYAPAGELQLEASASLEKKAYEDLDRILQLPDSSNSATALEQSLQTSRFYFTDRTVDLANPLKLEYYAPSLNISQGWVEVTTYPAQTGFTPRLIVGDLADAINQATLSGQTATNIIASPVLAGGAGFHYIEFTPRRAVNDITADVISVRFTYGTNSTAALPFQWGTEQSSVNTYWLNSLFLILRKTKFSSPTAEETRDAQIPYIYFKRDTAITPVTGNFSFRLSTTDDQTYTFEFPYEPAAPLPDRPGKLAVDFINKLLEHKRTSRLVGAIVRNDPSTMIDPLVAVEIIAWSVSNVYTWLTLDILEVPNDILIALGDLHGPYTSFSNKPRSVKIDTTYSQYFKPFSPDANPTNPSGAPSFIKMGRSKMLDAINDASEAVTGFNYTRKS